MECEEETAFRRTDSVRFSPGSIRIIILKTNWRGLLFP
jgi:hypothetical protein